MEKIPSPSSFPPLGYAAATGVPSCFLSDLNIVAWISYAGEDRVLNSPEGSSDVPPLKLSSFLYAISLTSYAFISCGKSP